MEFIMYLTVLISLYFVVFKPEKERLAFGLLWCAIAFEIGYWVVSTAASWVPGMTL